MSEPKERRPSLDLKESNLTTEMSLKNIRCTHCLSLATVCQKTALFTCLNDVRFTLKKQYSKAIL